MLWLHNKQNECDLENNSSVGSWNDSEDDLSETLSIKNAPNILIYLHGNGEDIGKVFGHCTDLASQLKWDVLIPELSGFGGFNNELLRKKKNKKDFIGQWVNDVENAYVLAQNIVGSDWDENITVYAKGMATSIVFKLMERINLK